MVLTGTPHGAISKKRLEIVRTTQKDRERLSWKLAGSKRPT